MATVDLVVNGTTGKVPLLDSNGKVLSENLPTNLPSQARIWRNNKASRNVGTYITHTGGNGNEMRVYLRSTTSTDVTRHFYVHVRPTTTDAGFYFRSDAQGATGDRWVHMYVDVPHGWQYSVLGTSGGSTNANIELWYEMY